MDEFGRREGASARPPIGESPGEATRPNAKAQAPVAAGCPAGVQAASALPPGGPEAFPWRVSIVGLDAKVLFGHADERDGPRSLSRPVHLLGRTVAFARVVRDDPLPGVELRFLRAQYEGIVIVALALVLLALAGAWWAAGRWVRPLLAIRRAVEKIASGDLAFRLPQTRETRGGDEIADVVRNVNLMAASLQRMEGSRRRWMADISHELRTPLTVLRGDLEAIVDGVRPLSHAALQPLHEEVLRLGAIVDDLQLLAMSTLRRLPCRFDETDAAALLRDAAERFGARAAALRMQLVVDLDPEAAISVRWDRARILQLLGNVLDNSLRYTDAPGRVRLTAMRRGERVSIDIDDSAPGIGGIDPAQLFEPLFRAAGSGAATGDERPDRSGSGLGLAIAKVIAEAHGGRIDASASPLGGLKIRIDLPAHPADSP